jgi:hypothetical protein
MGARVVWLAALAACYSPYEPECGFVCGDGGACPPDYTCASDNICHLNGSPAGHVCTQQASPFDLQSALATSSHQVAVTFTGLPNSTQATDPTNYSIAGLTVTSATVQMGAVTLETGPQGKMTYTLDVAGVTRASDGAMLTTSTATFAGRPPFDVASAAPASSTSLVVTFDAAPNSAQATNLGNYDIPGLTVSGTATLNGSAVTLTTTAQAAQSYTVTVSNVARASDFEPLTGATAMFSGRTPFDVMGAASTSALAMTVTFDAPPDMTQATTLGNYTVTGLTLSSPSLNGSTVTFTTTAQLHQMYTVDVVNVMRASDGEPLTMASAMFTGSTCTDLVKDGDETDTDCGGPTCAARCAMGQMCLVNADCSSNNCATTCQ